VSALTRTKSRLRDDESEPASHPKHFCNHDRKGSTVKPTGHIANTASMPKTGLFATLRGLLHVKGSGAPKITQGTGASSTGPAKQPRWSFTARKLAFCSLPAVVLLYMALSASPAVAPSLAAGPEKPELTVEDTTVAVATPSREALLHGVLNPKAAGEAGTYQFLYKASKTGVCTGGGVAPASPGMSFGFEGEGYYETIAGLAPGTEYAVCLRVENNAKTESASTLVTFTTAVEPEKPVTEAPKPVEITGTTAVLHGTLNPLAKGEEGTYEFYYQQSATECNPEHVAPEAAGTMTGSAGQAVSVTVTKLQALREYTFCLVATNKAGETATGSAVTFKTLAAKPTFVSYPAPSVKATGARLEAIVSPENETTECHFQYGETTVTEHELACEQGNALEGGEQTVGVNVTGLTQLTSYHYRVILKNSTGSTEGPPAEFTTITPEPPETQSATEVTATTAKLHGGLNPKDAGEPGTYEFVYREQAAGCQGAGQKVAGSGTMTVSEGQIVEAELSGLTPGATYPVCLVVHNKTGEEAVGPQVTFTTLAQPPKITTESASEQGPTTATLSAEINAGGAPTGYRVQYVTDAQFKEKGFAEPGEAPMPPAAEASAGSAGTTVTVHQELTGLQAGTEYHFRFIAKNAAGPSFEGAVETFTTPMPTESTGLPDGRVYEKVTPSDNYDADVYVPLGLPPFFVNNAGEFNTRLPFQVAPEGNAVAFVGAPTIDGTGNSGLGKGDEYLSRRAPDGGWGRPVDLQPLGENGAVIDSAYYQAFSPDLTVGILQSGSYGKPDASLPSPQAPGEGYAVLYTHNTSEDNYQSLFTTKPSNRLPDEFGFLAGINFPSVSSIAPRELAYAGASANYERLLFEANGAFAGTGAAEGGVEENNLYESAGGQLSLVNVLPDGATEVNATFGAKALDEPETNPPDFSNVISEDGSRVFWTDLNTNVVYLRENAGQPESPLGPHDECLVSSNACTVQVSAGAARYWSASADGRYAFYTEGEGEESELYRFDAERGPAGTSEVMTAARAGVQGVVGVSADGSTVYFVAQAKLAENTNSNGAEAETGAYNLYMLKVLKERSQPVFVAQLSYEDGEKAIYPLHHLLGGVGDWQPGVGHRTAEVTPDGGSLVFMSNDQSVDGHVEEVGGERLEEVYVYDAEDGQLSCASCGRERGVEPGVTPESEEGLGAFLPISNALTYQPTLISEDGSKVFFDSDEPLVVGDTNGEQDVYEWERDGSGGCGLSDGCVFLLSGGSGDTSSWLVGADASGDNVFMVTRAQLVPQDENENYDLYDARVDGVQPGAPPACTGTGCQGVPSAPPTFATPPSGTYEGVGNFPPPAPTKPVVKPKAKPLTRAQKLARALKACRKDRSAKKRAVCEATAKKRYGSASKAKSRKGGK
jgi:hypothetical protein